MLKEGLNLEKEFRLCFDPRLVTTYLNPMMNLIAEAGPKVDDLFSAFLQPQSLHEGRQVLHLPMTLIQYVVIHLC